MALIIERKVGETGNSLYGQLNNEAGTLTIPAGAAVTISATRVDTGALVIDAEEVTVVDQAARMVRYDFSVADLADELAGVTLDVEFAITPPSPDADKPTYIPDARANRILLVLNRRIAA